MYCPGCRSRISDMSAECPVCGLKLSNTQATHRTANQKNEIHSKKRKTPSSPGEFLISLFMLIVVLALSRSAWYKVVEPPPQQIESPHEYTNQNSEALEVLPQVTNAKDATVPAPTVTEERPTIPATEEITEPPAVQTEAPSSNSQIGSVLRSAGEVRIRSGPSTSYEDIGRLKGGTPVTIYEQQQEASGRWWGRMDDGWVCMDYIVFGEDNSIAPDYEMSTPRNKMSDYSGHWGDTVSMRCMMDITQGNDYLYISIKWGSSASSTTVWEFLGEYDASEGAVYYNNGVCYELETAEDGSQIRNTRYTNGEGVLVIQDGYLYWHDGTEGVMNKCIFERL